MSIKKTLLVLLASAFAVSVAFASAATKAPDKLACIGVIHPYFFPMKNAVEDFSKATGIPAIYQATKDFDMEEENTIIDGLTAQGYNGFALWPGHPYSVNVTIAALKKKGIPVIRSLEKELKTAREQLDAGLSVLSCLICLALLDLGCVVVE